MAQKSEELNILSDEINKSSKCPQFRAGTREIWPFCLENDLISYPVVRIVVDLFPNAWLINY